MTVKWYAKNKVTELNFEEDVCGGGAHELFARRISNTSKVLARTTSPFASSSSMPRHELYFY